MVKVKPRHTNTRERLSGDEGVKGSSDRSFGVVFAGLAVTRRGLLAPLNHLWSRFGLLLNISVRPLIMGLYLYGLGILCRAKRKQIVHFLHIGKTGGTAIRYALKDNTVTDHFVLRFHGHGFKLHNVPKGQKVVFFLRDPISRFVSGFYSRQRQGRPRIYSPWSDEERIAFSDFETPNELALALSSSDKVIQNKAINAMNSIEHVRSTFYHWFCDDQYLVKRSDDILFTGFQETLEDDFEQLKRILALPDALTLPLDETKAHKNPPNLDRHLDGRAIENLLRWYESDYHFILMCRKNT